MQKFLLKFFLFLIPVLLLGFWIFGESYEKEFGYEYISLGCRSGKYLHDRMISSEIPIDIAFIGTSEMMCAVNDVLLDSLLNTNSQNHREIANLGFCSMGRNLHYLILKDLLEHKKPEWVIIEVNSKENVTGHRDFGGIASGKELFFPESWAHVKYGRDIRYALKARLAYYRQKCLGLNPGTIRYEERQPSGLHSFLPTKRLASEESLLKGKAGMEKRKLRFDTQMNHSLSRAQLEFTWQLNRVYVQKMAALAKAHQVKISFVYLPAYGSPYKLPVDHDLYSELAEVWLPPDSVLAPTRYWQDQGHFNSAGARAFTFWTFLQITNNNWQ